MTKKRVSIGILLFWGFAMTQMYQNCAPVIGESGFDVMASTSVDDMNSVDSTGAHPLDESSKVSVRKQHVVSKDYVADLFREVFTSTKYPITNLDSLIDKWILYKGPQYGGSCNFYSDYSTKDCNGSTANANLPYFTEDNTVRESFRIQMCLNTLGVDNGLSGALEKIGATVTTPINQSYLTGAWGLFYRNDPPDTLSMNSLLDLNNTLTAGNVTLKERWRAILTQICESPGWQLF